MATVKRICKGKTKKGTACRNSAMIGSNLCFMHQPRGAMDKVSEATTPLSQQAVLEFLKRNREFTVGLLAGALTDQVVGDLWQYLKKKTGMDLLVPPISDLGSISQHYKQHHDYVSLAKLVPFIRLGMPREEVENLLGPPSEYYEERSMAFYLSDRWIDDLGRVTFYEL